MFRLSTAFLLSLAAAGLVACNGSDSTGPDQPAPTAAGPTDVQRDSSPIDASDASQPAAAADASQPSTASALLAAGRLPKSFYINSASGSDANPGTKLKPFKTLAKGLSLAISGDTMRLAAGGYSAATGEKFNSPQHKVTVPAGVTILGTAAEDFTSQLHGVAGETGLELLGGATIRDLNLTGFTWGIHASQGVQKLTGLHFSGNNTAIVLEQTAQATLVKGNVLLYPGVYPQATGAELYGTASLTLDGGTVAGLGGICNLNATGVSARVNAHLTAKNGALFKQIAGAAVTLSEYAKATLTSQAAVDRDFSLLPSCETYPSLVAYEGSSLTLTNARVDGKGEEEVGIEASVQGAVTITNSKLSGHYLAVNLLDKTKLVVTGSTFSGNSAAIFAAYGQPVTLTVTGSTLTGNGTAIMAPTLKLRNSQVTGNSLGMYLNGSSADLGKLASPGNNVLSGNGQSGVQLNGAPGASGTIYAVGNTWNSAVQGADGSGHYAQHPLLTGVSANAVGTNFKLPQGNANMKLQL
jgi:hypothetical protein